jgi:hypothetical protein
MNRVVRGICTVSLALLYFVIESPANAADPTTADCLAASENSLALKNQHRLLDARARLLVCSASTCPADIRDECIRRVAEVNEAMPTVVFEVKDVAGNDVLNVQVTMDGTPLVSRLEGTALSIDPGEHTFSFASPGQSAVEKKLVIREGEKGRRERVVPQALVVSSQPKAARLDVTTNPRRMAAIASAGVGVVAVGVGIVFGLKSLSRHHDAKQACPGACVDQHGVDLWNSARSAGNVSTVAFVLGAAGLAGGGILWFLSKEASPGAPAVQVGVGPGSIGMRGVW